MAGRPLSLLAMLPCRSLPLSILMVEFTLMPVRTTAQRPTFPGNKPKQSHATTKFALYIQTITVDEKAYYLMQDKKESGP
jgi:hypothetical protein